MRGSVVGRSPATTGNGAGVKTLHTRRQTRLSKFLVAILVVAGANLGLLGVAAGPGRVPRSLFSQHPIAGWSTNGPVHAVKIVGDIVYVGGDFSQVRGPGGSPVVARTNLFAINRNTGRDDPGLRRVHERHRARDRVRRHDVYVGGGFTTVNNTARRFIVVTRPGHRRAASVQPESAEPGLRPRRPRQLVSTSAASSTRSAASPRSRLALVDKTTGALDPTFNPAPDGAVRTFAFSPNGGRIYIGGDYLEHRRVSRSPSSSRSTRSPAPGSRCVFQQFAGPDARPRRRPERFHACTPRSAAHRVPATARTPGTPTPACACGATKPTVTIRPSSTRTARSTSASTRASAGNPLRHILGADAVTGVIDPNFQPNVNSFWGVWSIDAGSGTLAVGGEFTNFDGVAVQGIALLPSLFANDHTPPSDPTNLISTGHTSTTASLSWGGSTDNTQLSGYQVFRDGTQVGFSTSTNFTDGNLDAVDRVHLHGPRRRRERQRLGRRTAPVSVTTSLAARRRRC